LTPHAVLLHGFQDDPRELAALAPSLVPHGWRVSVPRAPRDTPAGPTWWDHDADGTPVPDTVLEALGVVERVVGTGTDGAHPTVLVGFSQGGALALAAVLRRGAVAAHGAACVSGFLLDPHAVDYDVRAASDRGTRVLLAHGDDDRVVDPQLARSAARLLGRHGVPVELTEQAGGHVLSAALCEEVRRWLGAFAPQPLSESTLSESRSLSRSEKPSRSDWSGPK
jgi:predicted esterase